MKNRGVTILVIIGVIILAIMLLNLFSGRLSGEVSKQTALCISEHSQIYVQLGCHACETQEKMFGDNYKYLNLTDCFFEKEKCIQAEIAATPTWIINGKTYIGVQSIEKLKELTGC
ncbi:hypothetical protein DRN69_04850 [Candidatus Pacearchaeota archaeon]|nr:MAG: hypothetical protein DRN69_04850 [Candidatus Pacearchaeota archaeon]